MAEGKSAFPGMQLTPEESEPPSTASAADQERFSGILVELLHRPVTGVVVLIAIATSVGVFAGMPIERFVTAEPVFFREPWRLISSALPHVDPLHLAFNIYWTWVLGGVIEERIGALRCLGLILLLAIVSDAAEYLVFTGGVGLSGVGYGLLGFLWARGRKDPSIWESIPRSTVPLFIGWFFLCIVLTYSDVMSVANLAHAAGFIVGGMIGLGWMRLTLALSAGTLILAAVARPDLNLSGKRGQEYMYYAWLALENGDDVRAVQLGAEAVEIDRDDAPSWFNYGIALHGVERYEDALAAYERAVELDAQYAEDVDLDDLRAYLYSTE